MAKVKSQRGAEALAALRERHRIEQELTEAYFAADAEVLKVEAALEGARRRRDAQLAAMAHRLGLTATANITDRPMAEVRQARGAYPVPEKPDAEVVAHEDGASPDAGAEMETDGNGGDVVPALPVPVDRSVSVTSGG